MVINSKAVIGLLCFLCVHGLALPRERKHQKKARQGLAGTQHVRRYDRRGRLHFIPKDVIRIAEKAFAKAGYDPSIKECLVDETANTYIIYFGPKSIKNRPPGIGGEGEIILSKKAKKVIGGRLWHTPP